MRASTKPRAPVTRLIERIGYIITITDITSGTVMSIIVIPHRIRKNNAA